MAERSISGRIGERVKVEDLTTVRLVLLREVKLNIVGPVTKNLYVFNGAGSIVAVDESDANIMLAMRRGHSCCGNELDHPMFQLAV